MRTKLFTGLLLLLIMAPRAYARGDLKSAMAELGLTLGTPAGLNLVGGLWGPSGFPLLIRASGMVWNGKNKFSGGQGQFGFTIGPRKDNRVSYIAATYVTMNLGGKNWDGYGINYGFNMYKGLAVDFGLSIGHGAFTSPQLVLQFGYSKLFY